VKTDLKKLFGEDLRIIDAVPESYARSCTGKIAF